MKALPLILLLPLACPSFGFAAPEPQQPSSANAWQQSQKTNVADDYPYMRFVLLGKFLSASRDGIANRPAFVVDCIPPGESVRGTGTFLAGNLVVGTNLKVVYVEPEEIRGISYFPKVDVRVRTDGANGEQQDQWSPGSGRTSASIPRRSLKEILRAHTVAITADDAQGQPVAMQFDMPDPSVVEQACHVDEG
jgi:hypothetical protein